MKSVDDQESQLNRCLSTQKSVGLIKQRRSISRDYEIQKSHVSTYKQTKNVNEIIKLKDILKQKDFNKTDKDNKEEIQSNPYKTECRTSYSRFNNCNCKNEITENDLILNQEILNHLDKIHQIVYKNDRFLSYRTQLDIKTDNFKKQERVSIQDKIKLNEQELDIFNNSKNYNLNYIILQQQQQISNLNSQLFSQEQMYIVKQQKYEQDIEQLKNQIMQLSNGLEKMKEHFNQKQLIKENNSNNIQLKK